MADNIRVAVRMRPLIILEMVDKKSAQWILEGSSVVQKDPPSKIFKFDKVFGEIDTNEIVYAEFCSPLVKSVIDGYDGTIFAYGQTSSGKTFTLMGKDNGKELGIAHYTISDIFNHIQERPEREFLLRVSYMEIDHESIYDLLSDENKHMTLTEDGLSTKVSGLSEHIVQTSEQVLQLMQKGKKKSKSGQTSMNETSSRSHSIFQVIIESARRGDENSAVNVSQFNLVDLAGFELVAQTGAKEESLTESKYINKSLLMLSQVIRQLSEKRDPSMAIEYGNSMLTRILQNSLGGSAITAIICTITPATVEETLSTLEFATLAKGIQNKTEVKLPEKSLMKEFANEIKKLSGELLTTTASPEKQRKEDMISKLRDNLVPQMPSKKDPFHIENLTLIYEKFLEPVNKLKLLVEKSKADDLGMKSKNYCPDGDSDKKIAEELKEIKTNGDQNISLLIKQIGLIEKQVYQVRFEIGHKASLIDKASAHTHKWIVFVRGFMGKRLANFVEKIVFSLHEDFLNPIRTIKEPPYFVTETGSKGFFIKIKIYFHKNVKPKTVSVKYDVFLRDDRFTDNLSFKIVEFVNPREEFRKQLLQCGWDRGLRQIAEQEDVVELDVI